MMCSFLLTFRSESLWRTYFTQQIYDIKELRAENKAKLFSSRKLFEYFIKLDPNSIEIVLKNLNFPFHELPCFHPIWMTAP